MTERAVASSCGSSATQPGNPARAAWLAVITIAIACDAPQEIPSRPLPEAFFGLDLQLEMEAPWPDDAGLVGHGRVRAWLAGGGLWADVQRNGRDGALVWDEVDRFVSRAAAHGHPVLYVVAATPEAAVSPENRSELCAWPTLYPGGCNPPDDWDDTEQGACLPPADAYSGPDCTYKEFLVRLVRRYRTAGRQDGCPDTDPQCHGTIEAYELGNEVDSYDWPDTRFWAGTATGRSTDSPEHAMLVLARMVEDAVDVIHREDPAAVVLAPSFTGLGVEDFERFASLDPSPLQHVDAVAFHGYPETDEEHPPEAIRALVTDYRAALERSPGAGLPLWDTEGGWGWNHGGPCTAGADNPCIASPWRQTAYLARWYLHQWDMGVETAIWFSWGNNGWGEIWCPNGNASEDHGIGCDELPDATPSVSRAGRAYSELSRWLTGATRTGRCERVDAVWTCGIERADLNDGHGVIAWHDDWAGFDGARTIPNRFTACRHLDGNEGPVDGAEVPVFSLPVLYH
ncbi:MAG: hypothetical protein KC619_23450 [Myxococcales bacterium]|nr:hypothetical protein [Myxococcales bacterium]